jgi:hypothetical protein
MNRVSLPSSRWKIDSLLPHWTVLETARRVREQRKGGQEKRARRGEKERKRRADLRASGERTRGEMSESNKRSVDEQVCCRPIFFSPFQLPTGRRIILLLFFVTMLSPPPLSTEATASSTQAR